MEPEKKQCKKCDQEFLINQNDFSFYERMKIPTPNICLDCRFKMRALWRNETSLYSGRKCGLCGESILSVYNPKSDYVAYCYKCYTSDSWDPMDYAQNYDINVPFFEQLNVLFHKVPKDTTFISGSDGPNINSVYVNMGGGMKDCYMVFNGGLGEKMMYCRGVRFANEVSDCYFGENIERCYECVNVSKSNGIIGGKNVINSVDSTFVVNCGGISNCFGCVNLRNKSNCWFNEQLTREEYNKKLNEIKGSYSEMKKKRQEFEKFCLQFPYKENNNLKAVNSVGDYLFECKDVNNSFEVIGAENSQNLFSSRSASNSDGIIGYGTKSNLLFECVAVGLSSNVIGSSVTSGSQDIIYSFGLKDCHDCIGCDGLKNAEYCILNKQYSKEEYEKIKEHIIKELIEQGLYGLMMPPKISPFAYNETIAQDNLPLTKEEALAQGFRWEDDIQMTKGKETLQSEEIPDHIDDVDDSVTEQVLRCIDCERNYKITKQELFFYRKMSLPIPRQCFYCRHRDRIKRRGPYKFWDRKCDHCGKDIRTNYSPERKEIVYCEECYKQAVF